MPLHYVARTDRLRTFPLGQAERPAGSCWSQKQLKWPTAIDLAIKQDYAFRVLPLLPDTHEARREPEAEEEGNEAEKHVRNKGVLQCVFSASLLSSSVTASS